MKLRARKARFAESGTADAPADGQRLRPTERRGTSHHVSCPTNTIFSTTTFSFERLAARLSQLAFLNKGLTIELVG